jgi:hypothetical protein
MILRFDGAVVEPGSGERHNQLSPPSTLISIRSLSFIGSCRLTRRTATRWRTTSTVRDYPHGKEGHKIAPLFYTDDSRYYDG